MSNRILYIEDDTALATVMTRAMMQRGYEVSHYDNLESLRAALPQLQFSFALLDLKIGNDNSLQVIEDIRAVAEVPIIILTGYGTIRSAVQAMKLGAINFLTKPCGVDEVLAALQDGVDSKYDNVPLEKPSLKSVEWEAIQKALDDNQGNISAAARQLKIHRRSLQRKLSKRHIDNDNL